MSKTNLLPTIAIKKCSHVWLDQKGLFNFIPSQPIPSLLTYKLWLIFMGMKQKKSKWPTQKKTTISKLPILKIFSRNFHGLVLGLIVLIDAKSIDVAQPIWSWGCPTLLPKWSSGFPPKKHLQRRGLFFFKRRYVKKSEKFLSQIVISDIAFLHVNFHKSDIDQ